MWCGTDLEIGYIPGSFSFLILIFSSLNHSGRRTYLFWLLLTLQLMLWVICWVTSMCQGIISKCAPNSFYPYVVYKVLFVLLYLNGSPLFRWYYMTPQSLKSKVTCSDGQRWGDKGASVGMKWFIFNPQITHKADGSGWVCEISDISCLESHTERGSFMFLYSDLMTENSWKWFFPGKCLILYWCCFSSCWLSKWWLYRKEHLPPYLPPSSTACRPLPVPLTPLSSPSPSVPAHYNVLQFGLMALSWVFCLTLETPVLHLFGKKLKSHP